MTVVTRCARCGVEIEVARDRIVVGPDWRYCDACLHRSDQQTSRPVVKPRMQE